MVVVSESGFFYKKVGLLRLGRWHTKKAAAATPIPSAKREVMVWLLMFSEMDL